MKYSILIISFLFLSGVNLFGQDIDLNSTDELIILSIDGDVKNGNSEDALNVGDAISSDDFIQIEENSSVRLTKNGNIYNSQNIGRVSVMSILESGKESVSPLMQSFFKSVSTGKGYVDKGKKESKDDSQSKGWGKKDKIFLNLPAKTKVPAKLQTFKWTKKGGANAYTVNISQNGVNVLSVQTASNQLTIDLSELMADKNRSLNMSVIADGDVKSEPVEFTIAKEGEKAAAIAALYNEPQYQSASSEQKAMMKAAAYEAAGLHTLADMKYRKALFENPKNKLLNTMYQAFLYRNGLGFLAD